jgi:hypothetical protein
MYFLLLERWKKKKITGRPGFLPRIVIVLPALVCWVCQPRLIKISGFFPVLVGYVT